MELYVMISCNWYQTIIGVLGAFFGVQSEKQRQKDFATKNIWPYIFVACILTVLFIFILVVAAKFMLKYFAAS